ncbi:MAG: PfkB family carbohydrate kinase [Anaerolineales bacterium]
MPGPERYESIDYLAVGHITVDVNANEKQIGGSVAYAALTAQALGMKAGIVTTWAEELPLGPLQDIPIFNLGADQSTSFENIYTDSGRQQRLHSQAPFLEFHHIPEGWRKPRILHVAPVAREVSPRILKYFGDSTIGLTPQGWLREWDDQGNVRVADWEESDHILGRADATIIGREDVNGDQARIERMAYACPVLVVTDGAKGATLYTQGEEHKIEAPTVNQVDPTGAGDIFAAAFFVRLHLTGDALDAARFATQLAAHSVQRPGLDGVPTQDEIYDLMAEAL